MPARTQANNGADTRKSPDSMIPEELAAEAEKAREYHAALATLADCAAKLSAASGAHYMTLGRATANDAQEAAILLIKALRRDS